MIVISDLLWMLGGAVGRLGESSEGPLVGQEVIVL